MNVAVATRSIRSISEIVLRVPNALGNALEKVLALSELDIDHVSAECLVVAQGAPSGPGSAGRARCSGCSGPFLSQRCSSFLPELVMRFPQFAGEILNRLKPCLRLVDMVCAGQATPWHVTAAPLTPRFAVLVPLVGRCQPDAKTALLYLIGEHGDKIENAPYILEPIIDNLKTERLTSVRLALLTATVRLFLRRPPETQAMLGRLLHMELAGDLTYQTEPHDRALLYYRLLQQGVDAVRRRSLSLHNQRCRHLTCPSFAKVYVFDSGPQGC